jgi:hypothetical protein
MLGVLTLLQRDLYKLMWHLFDIRRKCPFKSTKSYTKQKCRSRSLPIAGKIQLVGQPVLQPRRKTPGPHRQPARPRIRPDMRYGRASDSAGSLKDLPGNRDLAERGIRPDLVRSSRAWDSESLKPTLAESGFRPELSNSRRPSVGFRPDPVKNSVAKPVTGGRERDCQRLGDWVQRERVFLSICFE